MHIVAPKNTSGERFNGFAKLTGKGSEEILQGHQYGNENMTLEQGMETNSYRKYGGCLNMSGHPPTTRCCRY
jgi:hypothetical protein